jgi:hypothetical protein
MRILRYEVPVDGKVHTLQLSGAIVHTAAREETIVEFWALDGGQPAAARHLLVVSTGAAFPESSVYLGTAVTSGDGRYVWHLLEVPR